MIIRTTKTKLIVELRLYQDVEDWDGKKIGETNNIIGVQAGDEQGICKVLDRTYKGKDPDIGGFIINTYHSEKEFKEMCESLGIEYYKYLKCVKCGEVIHGSHSWDNGPLCFDCEEDEEYNDDKIDIDKFLECIPNEQLKYELTKKQLNKFTEWLTGQTVPIGGVYRSDLNRWINQYNKHHG